MAVTLEEMADVMQEAIDDIRAGKRKKGLRRLDALVLRIEEDRRDRAAQSARLNAASDPFAGYCDIPGVNGRGNW